MKNKIKIIIGMVFIVALISGVIAGSIAISDNKDRTDITNISTEKTNDVSSMVFNIPLKEYTLEDGSTEIGIVPEEMQSLYPFMVEEVGIINFDTN